MPYVSEAQRRYMHAQQPRIAKRWDKKYPTEGKLPEKVEDRTAAYKRAMDGMR